jgi:Mce-associated membrane protein
MAKPAGTAGHMMLADLDDIDTDDADEAAALDDADEAAALDDADDARPAADHAAPLRTKLWRVILAVAILGVIALGCVAGWLGYRLYGLRTIQAQDEALVAAARQGALSLTTIAYPTVDSDVRRILDSSTGAFHDDFQKRSQPFSDVVKKAQSKSEGTILASGLQSTDGDQGKVLVIVSVKIDTPGVPQAQPKSWRMQISLQKVGGVDKISDVQFVS